MLLQQQNLPSSQLGGLILYLEGIDRARCVAIASFTIILYDYCSTLDDEVSLAFKRTRIVKTDGDHRRSNISGQENGPYLAYYFYSSVSLVITEKLTS
jgi:hypothetical protein